MQHPLLREDSKHLALNDLVSPPPPILVGLSGGSVIFKMPVVGTSGLRTPDSRQALGSGGIDDIPFRGSFESGCLYPTLRYQKEPWVQNYLQIGGS